MDSESLEWGFEGVTTLGETSADPVLEKDFFRDRVILGVLTGTFP